MERKSKIKQKNTTTLFIILPAITLVIAFVVFSFLTKTFVFAEEERAAYTKYTYPLEEVIVNLKDGKHYLKASLALGYGLSDDVGLIQEKEVQIRDTILNILRSKDADEITPIEHTMRLKNEIKGKLNELFSQDIIMDVYITDFLIQ